MTHPHILHKYQQAVVDEKAALDLRLIELEQFLASPLYTSLTNDEQLRLARQQRHMAGYSKALAERIGAFAP